MSEVTVKQLATDIGASVERLLKQITDAGLSSRDENGAVSDEEKLTLLTFLKQSHGSEVEGEGEPKKITLKRKTSSTLKMSSGQGRTKTINVEVRKKRTYVKRPDVSLELEKQKVEDADNAAKIADEIAKKALAEDASVIEAVSTGEKAPTEVKVEATVEKATEVSKKSGVKTNQKVASPADLEKNEKHQKHKKKEKVVKTEPEEVPAKKHIKSAGHRAPRQREEVFSAINVNEDDETPNKPRKLKGKKKKIKRSHAFEKPVSAVIRDVMISETIIVSELADRMSIKSTVVIKSLMAMGVMATVNQAIDQETAVLVAEDLVTKFTCCKKMRSK